MLSSTAAAELVTYEGKLSVDGVPFTGLGHFKFAVIGDQGETLWTSKALSLSVAAGNYAVRWATLRRHHRSAARRCGRRPRRSCGSGLSGKGKAGALPDRMRCSPAMAEVPGSTPIRGRPSSQSCNRFTPCWPATGASRAERRNPEWRRYPSPGNGAGPIGCAGGAGRVHGLPMSLLCPLSEADVSRVAAAVCGHGKTARGDTSAAAGVPSLRGAGGAGGLLCGGAEQVLAAVGQPVCGQRGAVGRRHPSSGGGCRWIWQNWRRVRPPRKVPQRSSRNHRRRTPPDLPGRRPSCWARPPADKVTGTTIYGVQSLSYFETEINKLLAATSPP